jgi:hypothetical protein
MIFFRKRYPTFRDHALAFIFLGNSGGIVGLVGAFGRMRGNSRLCLRLAPLEIFAQCRAQALLALFLFLAF